MIRRAAFLGLCSLLSMVGRVSLGAESVSLWPEGAPDAHDVSPEAVRDGRISNVHVPTLTIYSAAAADSPRAAVIVCPGGGYQRLAVAHEGQAAAEWLNTLGMTAFVLKYRLAEYGHPAPLRDVLRAVRTVRQRAAEWKIDPGRIGVLGFSAGGHLAASAATLFDGPEGKTGAALDSVAARPDFAILIYPVITFKDPYAHRGSRVALLGEGASADLVARLSLEGQVTAATPPVFLVHGSDDGSVPAQNSVLFYLALKDAGVSAELHVFAHGPHGFGLKPGHGPISDWPALCGQWLVGRGILDRPSGKP